MCGIAGIWAGEVNEALTARMMDSIAHRGPDGSGFWSDHQAGISLAHRRLAILDLSPAGRQPMLSRTARYIISLNGEIYNFRDLATELSREMVTKTDTEVALACIEEWGLVQSVKKFVGMFAFALWDRKEQVLCLVRDRLGKKPLYYSSVGNDLCFGSELSALVHAPGFSTEYDLHSLACYFETGVVPGPRTVFRGTSQVAPGTILSVARRDGVISFREDTYWSVDHVVRGGLSCPFPGDENDALIEAERIIKDAVRLRMVSDVPIGCFLSSGIDSSLVAGVMQSLSSDPVQTFSIGFADTSYDESLQAGAIAQHLGTNHERHILDSNDIVSTVSRLGEIWDEPFADSSQVPMLLVSQRAKRKVTVVLSGDGGDEVFGGYYRHFNAAHIERLIGAVPQPLRLGVARIIQGTPASLLNKAASFLPGLGRSAAGAGSRLYKFARILKSESIEEAYWTLQASADAKMTSFPTPTRPVSSAHCLDSASMMMYYDSLNYLPNDILVKVDRATMRHGLEARAPLLDHRLMEFAWTLPVSFKIQGRMGKIPLRRILDRYVPKELSSRPKSGFGGPVDSWLRVELRGWAEDLLSESSLAQSGFLDVREVRGLWKAHLSGERNAAQQIWAVLMFESWRGRSWG